MRLLRTRPRLVAAPPRPMALDNIELWQEVCELRREVISQKLLNAGLRKILRDWGDLTAIVLSMALAEAYPGKSVEELQEMSRQYVDRAEMEQSIAELERLAEVS